MVEIEEERDIDDDYPDEDEEMTEDDRREKTKIAIVMVDLWETADDPSVTGDEHVERKCGVSADCIGLQRLLCASWELWHRRSETERYS